MRCLIFGVMSSTASAAVSLCVVALCACARGENVAIWSGPESMASAQAAPAPLPVRGFRRCLYPPSRVPVACACQHEGWLVGEYEGLVGEYEGLVGEDAGLPVPVPVTACVAVGTKLPSRRNVAVLWSRTIVHCRSSCNCIASSPVPCTRSVWVWVWAWPAAAPESSARHPSKCPVPGSVRRCAGVSTVVVVVVVVVVVLTAVVASVEASSSWIMLSDRLCRCCCLAAAAASWSRFRGATVSPWCALFEPLCCCAADARALALPASASAAGPAPATAAPAVRGPCRHAMGPGAARLSRCPSASPSCGGALRPAASSRSSPSDSDSDSDSDECPRLWCAGRSRGPALNRNVGGSGDGAKPAIMPTAAPLALAPVWLALAAEVAWSVSNNESSGGSSPRMASTSSGWLIDTILLGGDGASGC